MLARSETSWKAKPYVASATAELVRKRDRQNGAGGPVCTTRTTEFSFSLAA